MSSKERFYIPSIDGLRFIAFLLVFFSHLALNNSYLGRYLHNYGWIGVELFFLLSSYLLTKILLNEYELTKSVNIKKFFLRRILRIWPLYFAFLAGSMFFLYLGFHEKDQYYTIGRLFGLLTFTDNILTALRGFNNIPFSPHLWSISFEEQFYVLLPFILPFFIKSRNKVLNFIIIIWAYIICLRVLCVLMKFQGPFIWTLIIQGDTLLLGILLAFGTLNKFFAFFNPVLQILIGTILLWLLCYLPDIDTVGFHQVYMYTLIGFGFIFIVNGVITSDNKIIHLVFGNALIRYLGKISYGLYVFHLICIYFSNKLILKLGISNHWFTSFILACSTTIIISVLSYEIYEKKFLKLKEKYTIIKSRPV